MGLFDRNASQSTPPPAESLPAIGDEDLIAAADVLVPIEEATAVQDDTAIRVAARSIAWAGGIRPDGDLLTWASLLISRDPSASPFDRPWRWLEAVAGEALRRGDLRLAGRIGFFVAGWRRASQGMGMADEADCGGLGKVPDEAYVAALGNAVRALSRCEATAPIVETTAGTLLAGGMLPALAAALLAAEQSGTPITAEAREAALAAIAA